MLYGCSSHCEVPWNTWPAVTVQPLPVMWHSPWRGDRVRGEQGANESHVPMRKVWSRMKGNHDFSSTLSSELALFRAFTTSFTQWYRMFFTWGRDSYTKVMSYFLSTTAVLLSVCEKDNFSITPTIWILCWWTLPKWKKLQLVSNCGTSAKLTFVSYWYSTSTFFGYNFDDDGLYS